MNNLVHVGKHNVRLLETISSFTSSQLTKSSENIMGKAGSESSA